MVRMAKPTRFIGLDDEPLQIFHDNAFENITPMTSHAPMPSVPRTRRPLPGANPKATMTLALDPPPPPLASCSPYKGKSSLPRAPLRPSQSHKLNMVPMAWPATDKGPVTDSLQKKQHRLSKFRIGSQEDAADSGDRLDKENVCPIFPAPPPTIALTVDNCYPRIPSTSRPPVEAAPPHVESAPVQKPKMEETAIPSWDSFPPIIDDGTKPQSSYAQLIGMAILRSPQRRLTLSQIYKWISEHYSFYAPTDAGWQNSIRHNLSLHKSFIKIERAKDDPGKGNYWGIEPGNEHLFLKEKPTRKCVPTAENMPVMSARMEPSQPAVPSLVPPEPTLPPLVPAQQCSSLLPPPPHPQAAVSPAPEPSSDATISLPDNPALDDINECDGATMDNGFLSAQPWGMTFLQSPSPANMLSSPILKRHSLPHDTPSCRDWNPQSSASRSHKRKFASMDDSGYISSLESSVIRPNHRAMLLTSEVDRPRIKRGRAEEEIARLRGSSPFSPIKARSFPSGPGSSPPLRQAFGNPALFPLTPMVKVKPPVQPPPSVSPNTSLRVHRDKVRSMLQSPLRRVAGIMEEEEVIPWSPAFHLDETLYACEDLSPGPMDFDIFQDIADAGANETFDSGIGSVLSGSPIKRSTVKRRRPLDRTVSNPVTGDKAATSAPKRTSTTVPSSLALVDASAQQLFDTPSKVIDNLCPSSTLLEVSPCKVSASIRNNLAKVPLLELPGNEWQRVMGTADLAADVNADYTGGVDILKGFQKIGSSRANKAGLGRSFSTTF